VVFSYFPLLKTPLTISHADALGGISHATGGTIHMHFSSNIPTLISELASFSNIDDEERKEAVCCCFRAVCHSVDTTGVNWLVSEIASKCTHDKQSVRKEACWAFQVVVEESECICVSQLYDLCMVQMRIMFQNPYHDSNSLSL
jgi:hypothetical protein